MGCAGMDGGPSSLPCSEDSFWACWVCNVVFVTFITHCLITRPSRENRSRNSISVVILTAIKVTGFICCHWQNLSITAVSVLPSSRSLFYMQYGFQPRGHSPMLGQLSRGFSLRTLFSGCSIYIYFLRSSWKKHRLLVKTMQVSICNQLWTLWLVIAFAFPAKILFSASF